MDYKQLRDDLHISKRYITLINGLEDKIKSLENKIHLYEISTHLDYLKIQRLQDEINKLKYI